MITIKELRKPRLFGIALFDLVSATVGMVLIFLFFHAKFFANLPVSHFIIAAVLLTIPVGIVFHVLFGVNTTLNNRLGLSDKPKND